MLKLNTVTMILTMHAYSSIHTTTSFPRTNFKSPLFHKTLFICNVYVLNNLFTTYANSVFATFLLIVQKYRECDVRRLRDIGVLVFFGNCMSLRKRNMVKAGEGERYDYQLWLLRRRHVRYHADSFSSKYYALALNIEMRKVNSVLMSSAEHIEHTSCLKTGKGVVKKEKTTDQSRKSW